MWNTLAIFPGIGEKTWKRAYQPMGWTWTRSELSGPFDPKSLPFGSSLSACLSIHPSAHQPIYAPTYLLYVYMCFHRLACICSCVCACVHMHICSMRKPLNILGCHFSVTISLFSGKRSFIGLQLTDTICWLTSESPRDLPVSAFPELGLQVPATVPRFSCRFWLSKSGLHACVARLSRTELSP